ncbi:hypothetical protein VaNZ11_004041 [Volvox africanus]|uniref:Protease Do-like PDZ domain-containing protein n=1 Tax=Volvox africanus TaxID=51714 RepID=A0ABQ5RVG5_9CHLO|nr:hypothetical protein VaNZ11_004041 [Volvox africanus]
MARSIIVGNVSSICCKAIGTSEQPAYAVLSNSHLSAASFSILAYAQGFTVKRRFTCVMPTQRLFGLGHSPARLVSEATHRRARLWANPSATPPNTSSWGVCTGTYFYEQRHLRPEGAAPLSRTFAAASRSVSCSSAPVQLPSQNAAITTTGGFCAPQPVTGAGDYMIARSGSVRSVPMGSEPSDDNCLVRPLPLATPASGFWPAPSTDNAGLGGGLRSTLCIVTCAKLGTSFGSGVGSRSSGSSNTFPDEPSSSSATASPSSSSSSYVVSQQLRPPPPPPPGSVRASPTATPKAATATATGATTASAAATAVAPVAAAFTPTRSYSQHIKSDRALLATLKDAPQQYARGMGSVLDSIIKIYTVHSRPNYTLPWQNQPKRESTGTGFMVHDRLILTNAHVVADATYVLVKRHGSGTKYRADVQAVGHDCDLALLSVEDESFWSSPTAMLPLELGSVPELQQGVVVVGYPTGGDNTSITSGVVSRVEVAQYAHAASHLMACQIDAAINPGNSGGPALQGDQVVGVAFQNLPGAENIGYIIPTPVVCHFLAEVRKYGSYQGYCSLGVLCQNLENPHLRAALGMSEGMTGVLVNTIQKTSNAAKVLKPGDVLLEFDGVRIANDGTVHLRQRERIYFSYLITLKPTGATAKVKVLREGQVLSYDLVVTPNDLLVPVHCYDRLPSYFMYAGLVFVPLTQPYLHEYGEDWMNTAPRRLYDKAMHGMMQKPHQQTVILSQVLVDDVNTGYQQFQSLQVLRVNGVEVLNLSHLKELVAGASEGFVRFELEDERIMVVDRSLAQDANRRIMERYRVPSSVSADIE